MNKTCHPLTCLRLIPALLFCTFLLSSCADSPKEIRYDNRMRTYTSTSNDTVRTSTVGQDNKLTANYIIRPGHRPDFAPRAQQASVQHSPSTQQMAEKTQVEDLQMVLEVSDVLFDFDKWVIKAEVVPELDKWASYFRENPEVTADIYGHADSTGPSEYNQNLSVKRAQAVVNYLAGKGVDPKRFTARGFGESRPAAPNSTKEGRQKNRRVELNL